MWHIARSVVPLRLTGLRLDPLSDPAAVELARVLSPAVLVGTPNRPELRPVIAGLDLVGLVEAQRRPSRTPRTEPQPVRRAAQSSRSAATESVEFGPIV